jgi:hypothetical protein
MKLIILTILVSVCLFSCKKDDNQTNIGNHKIVGTWINPQYNDTLVTYYRAGNLKENELGFTFKTDNTCVARQNSGWCGTPPITTADYEGTWTSTDSTVNVNVGYWGGTIDYTWKIISVDDKKLTIATIKVLYQNGG